MLLPVSGPRFAKMNGTVIFKKPSHVADQERIATAAGEPGPRAGVYRVLSAG